MNSNGDSEETQAIPPIPPDPSHSSKPSVPLPSKSKNEEETQVISPVTQTHIMPPARPSGDDEATRVGMPSAGYGANDEETQVISPSSSSKEEENPAETTMYLGAVGDGG
ncbi:MAG: hypothetical protein J6P18_01815, partial [Aeriscardovia sp.]|nr:hypothetical protein [Aeriscardovia sp.]